MEFEEVFKNRVYALLRERNLEKAKNLLEREIEEDSKNFKNYELLGDIYLEKEEEDKALENYEKAFEMLKDREKGIGLLPLIYKVKRIKGESPDVNVELARLFMNHGLKKQFENTFMNYLKGLINSKNKEEGINFIENLFEDEPTRNEFLFYFLSNFGEGNEFLQKAIEGHKAEGNKAVVEKLKGFTSGGGIDVGKLKEVINIEGIEERKLEPQGTLELAELLDNIGSKEEALNEYFSSIYSFIVEGNDIEKCKEIMEKIKQLGVEDPRIEKVEEFLNNPPTGTAEIDSEKINEIIKSRIDEIVDENTENLKELARAFSESFLHSESVKIFEDLIERNVDIKDVLEYYLYSLYETGEYEKIIELPGDVPEDKESVVDFFKGLAYEKLGETNKALEILNEIYEKSPDFMDIEERLRKLKGEEIVEKAVEEEVEKVAVVEEPEEIIEEVVEEFKEEVPERVVEPVPEKKEKKGLNERIAIIY